MGCIDFYPLDQTLPTSGVTHPTPMDTLFWIKEKSDEYQDIIGTLRYEKPLFIYIKWDANNNITGHIWALANLNRSVSKKELERQQTRVTIFFYSCKNRPKHIVFQPNFISFQVQLLIGGDQRKNGNPAD